MPEVKFVGCVPDFVGFYPSHPIPTNYHFLDWLCRSEYKADDDINEFLLKTRVHLTSGFDTQLPILREYASASNTKYTANDLLDILDEEDYPWIKLPKLKFPDVEDLKNVFVKSRANSGYYTSKFFGTDKFSSAVPSHRAAEYVFEQLKSKEFYYEGLWSLYGRSKITKLSLDPEEPLQTRCVWVPEHFLVILGGLIVQQFTWSLQSIKRNCLFIGKNFKSSEIKWIHDMDGFADFKGRCDWSHFDANVSSEEMLAALSLISKCYGEDDLVVRYFSLMYWTLKNKNLVVPPGFVYRFEKGLPSGHPFTSLVGTLVNYIRWVVILQKVYGRGRVSSNSSACFAGDDTNIWLKYNENVFNIDKIITSCSPDWKCDSVVESLVPSVQILDESQPHFLKRGLYKGGIIGWSLASALKAFSYPKNHKFSDYEQRTWFYDMVVTAPGNLRLNHIILEYLSYRIHQTYSDPVLVKHHIYTLRDTYFRCLVGGISHQTEVSLVSYFLPYMSFNWTSNLNLHGKVMISECYSLWNNASSQFGSLSDLALMCIVGGSNFLANNTKISDNVPFLGFNRIAFSGYDVEIISRLIGNKNRESLLQPLRELSGELMDKLGYPLGISGSFRHQVKEKLRKLFRIDKELAHDINYFAKLVTQKEGLPNAKTSPT